MWLSSGGKMILILMLWSKDFEFHVLAEGSCFMCCENGCDYDDVWQKYLSCRKIVIHQRNIERRRRKQMLQRPSDSSNGVGSLSNIPKGWKSSFFQPSLALLLQKEEGNGEIHTKVWKELILVLIATLSTVVGFRNEEWEQNSKISKNSKWRTKVKRNKCQIVSEVV